MLGGQVFYERDNGGGSGASGSDGDRIGRLEQQFDKIGTQLADIKTLLGTTAKATDVAEIKGQLSQMPKALDFVKLRDDLKSDISRLDVQINRLAERVNNAPQTWQMMVGFVGIIIAIIWKTGTGAK